jgi:Tlde1 domain
VREYLLGVGIAGVVASAVTFAPMFEGAARSAHSGSPGERLIDSAFAAIYSDSEDDDAPASSQNPGVQLASLDTDFTGTIASAGNAGQTAGSSFRERFYSSYGERFSSFEERFGAKTDGDREPAPRSVQRVPSLPAAELGRDRPARLEGPKRANTRLAMLNPGATEASLGAAPSKATREADPSRTAIYDISRRLVYLPNGDRLEAHSGFGEHMDDVRSVRLKMRGVTPPNVYELSERERPFHGVRAIRLNPVDPDKMYGRKGILAHSYLLGANGQSNGCVSISDYPKFLNAFLNGDIDRLVVVERLADPPPSNTAVGWISDRIKALFKLS